MTDCIYTLAQRNASTNYSNENKTDRYLLRLFDESPGRDYEKKLRRREDLLLLAERFLASIPNECWKTEATLAKDLNTSTRQIKYVKRYLENEGKIFVEHVRNGRRPNPKHRIWKVGEKAKRTSGESLSPHDIQWYFMEELGPAYMNNLSVEDTLDLLTEMRMPFIPLHFPKFNKNGIVSCSCRFGRHCASIGKHPAIEFKALDFSKRSTFLEMKSYWLGECHGLTRGDGAPRVDIRFNIGFLTAGFAVIDIDRRYFGHLSLGILEEIYGELPRNLMVETGNGVHIYVSNELATSVNVLGYQGIDIRSRGDYIIAPFSTHWSGRSYRWTAISQPDSVPSQLAEELGESSPSRVIAPVNSTASFANGNDESEIAEQRRNTTLHRIASSLRGRGKNEREIYAFISSVNQARCKPPLQDCEVISIAKSAHKLYQPNWQKKLLALAP